MLLALCSVSAKAQQNEEVMVEGTFRPQIRKSERIAVTPGSPNNNFDIPEYGVESKDFLFDYQLNMETLSPVSYKDKDEIPTTDNFLMAKFGTRVSPTLLFRHHSEISSDMELGVGVKHNSTWLEIDDYPSSKYMNNALNVSMTNHLGLGRLHSFVEYHHDRYKMIDRRYNTLQVNSCLSGNSSGFKSIYDEIGIDYRYTGIHDGNHENLLNVRAHVKHSNKWFGGESSSQEVAADLKVTLSGIKETLTMIALNPRFVMNDDFYRLNLGLTLDAKTSDGASIYPNVKGSLFLFDKNMEIYAGIDGYSKINTLSETVEENPFIFDDFIFSMMGELGYTKTKFDLQAGVKGKIVNKISAGLGVRLRNVDNGMFYQRPFYNVPLPIIDYDEANNELSVVYDDFSETNIVFDVQYRHSEQLTVGADLSFNSFDMENEEKPWYKPGFDMRLKALYQYDQNWLFRASAIIEGKRPAVNSENKSIELDPLFDIRLGCDYKFDDHLAFCGDITNTFHNKYRLYFGFPSYGFQVFAGIKYKW